MPILIRNLVRPTDAGSVEALYHAAADYIALETGLPVGPHLVEEFFTDAPPGIDPERGEKLGLFCDGQLAGIADLAFGWPEPDDAYLGLMLFDARQRDAGLGRAFLDHVKQLARSRGAPRLLLAVLDKNPRGRAFWEREGFRVVHTAPPVAMGKKTHIRHRMECRL